MKKIVFFLVGICLFTSCSEFLTQEPSTSLTTETAIKTTDDLANAVNGVYYTLTEDEGSYGTELVLYGDMMGGDFDFIGNNNHGPTQIAMRQLIAKETLTMSFYTVPYYALARLNHVLSVAGSMDEDVDSYIAELYALRGLLHFDISKVFAPLPTSGSTNTMGIVLSDQVFDISYIGARASLDDTYEQIVSDLTTAIDMGVNKETNYGHMNYWAALGLRARAYLYMGEYEKALADCDSIIAESPYTLYTIANYTSVWSTTASSESMFEIIMTDNYNGQRYSPGYYCSASGYAECAATDAFRAFLQSDSNDVRSQMVAYEEDADGNYGGYYPQKYPGQAGASIPLYVNNAKVIRLSEIYLIAAEAALKSKTAADAAGYINTLRKNRITGYTDVATVTLTDILNERRKELFAEGHGALDFWRNKLDVQTVRVGTVTAVDSTKTILPIPQDEIDLSGGILVQNPGF